MIEVKLATPKDVDSIVAIHNQAFPDFFLTTLGNRFLRLYYNCMCNCKDALTLCAIHEGTLVGFSSTALNSAGFNTKLIKQNSVIFVMEAIKLLFTKPTALVRLVKNFTMKSSDMEDNGDYADYSPLGSHLYVKVRVLEVFYSLVMSV